MDKEVLLEWATHADLTILQQDEDLMLADVESLPLLKQFVHRSDILPGKLSILLSALCVLVYDNIPHEDDPAASNETLLKDVTRFLVDNVQLFQSIDDSYIHNYVKGAVYPRIGLRPPTEG